VKGCYRVPCFAVSFAEALRTMREAWEDTVVRRRSLRDRWIERRLNSQESCGEGTSDRYDFLPRRCVDQCSGDLHERDIAKSTMKTRRQEKEEQTTGETKLLYARQFLKHITGLGFFNRNMPDISIVFVAGTHENSRPHAHTCERSLDIPFGAYENNKKTLDKYLNDACLQSPDHMV
jgi:hypothetical protein